MEDLHANKLTDFDTLFCRESISIWKAFALFLPADKQMKAALVIKFLEISELLELLKKYKNISSTICSEEHKPDMMAILSDLKASLSKDKGALIDQIISMIKMMEMAEQMKDLMEVLGPDCGFGGVNGLEGILGGDNKELFEMLKGLMK